MSIEYRAYLVNKERVFVEPDDRYRCDAFEGNTTKELSAFIQLALDRMEPLEIIPGRFGADHGIIEEGYRNEVTGQEVHRKVTAPTRDGYFYP